MKKILIWLENIRYRMSLNAIMSNAMEYDIKPDVLEKWQDSCYENHIIRLSKIVN